MGGYGSGSWRRWDTKETTEGLYAVDIRYLHRNGLLAPERTFHLQWSRNGAATGSISGVAGDSEIVLLYRSRPNGQEEWDNVRERVALDWTPCHYGGRRPWFLCPGRSCGRRVAVLYSASKYFLCRHCYHLTYATCSMDITNRAREKEQKIRRRLGGSESLMAPFPNRPKGMHGSTYFRLSMEAHAAAMTGAVAMQAHIDRLDAWLKDREKGDNEDSEESRRPSARRR
jgi:hypothetical protein